MKKYEVAIIVDVNGNPIGSLKCKLVDEKQYHELKEKHQNYLQLEEHKKVVLLESIEKLEKQIEELKEEIKVLKGEDDNEEVC